MTPWHQSSLPAVIFHRVTAGKDLPNRCDAKISPSRHTGDHDEQQHWNVSLLRPRRPRSRPKPKLSRMSKIRLRKTVDSTNRLRRNVARVSSRPCAHTSRNCTRKRWSTNIVFFFFAKPTFYNNTSPNLLDVGRSVPGQQKKRVRRCAEVLPRGQSHPFAPPNQQKKHPRRKCPNEMQFVIYNCMLSWLLMLPAHAAFDHSPN